MHFNKNSFICDSKKQSRKDTEPPVSPGVHKDTFLGGETWILSKVLLWQTVWPVVNNLGQLSKINNYSIKR